MRCTDYRYLVMPKNAEIATQTTIFYNTNHAQLSTEYQHLADDST